MVVCTNNSNQSLTIYRKSPNYFVLGMSTFIGSLAGALYASAVQKQMNLFPKSVLYLGALSGFGFLHQSLAYKNRNKPLLIIDEKGLWYDGIWFKRNIFLRWDDIKSITWNETSSGFISFDSMTIWSRLHFPFIITTWNLDIDPEELWKTIKIFYP